MSSETELRDRSFSVYPIFKLISAFCVPLFIIFCFVPCVSLLNVEHKLELIIRIVSYRIA